MEESAREDAEDSLKLSGSGGGGEGAGDKFALIGYSETQWVRAFLAGPSVHISQRRFIFPFRHLFFRKRPDSMLKLFREYINYSGFAVHRRLYLDHCTGLPLRGPLCGELEQALPLASRTQ
jgi:hypothetical protein